MGAKKPPAALAPVSGSIGGRAVMMENGMPIEAHNGRYGPYVKCGEETRSLGDDLSPLDVTLEQALVLLAQPKTRRGTAKASKEPIKLFGESPVTKQPVKVISGRYGPYVTDGVTNASLPKDAPPEEITFEYALNLLQARVEAGPSKRSFRRKSTAKPAGKTAKKPASKKKK